MNDLTPLEAATLGDGFRLALLGVHADRGGWRQASDYRRFDGGLAVVSDRQDDSLYSPRPAYLAALRHHVAAVLAPPHVLAVYGSGWRELLRQILPDTVHAALRILDLPATARALAGGLPARAGLEALARAYRLGGVRPDEEVDAGGAGGAWSDLLWAVIAKAGQAGVVWPELLAVAAKAVRPAPFEHYAFAPEAIAVLPAAPAVYIMRDAAGDVLYVGQSGNLARRMGEYFRAAAALPDKVRELRARLHDFEYRPVGSELEALLLEHRLIGELAPPVNTQRRVAEAPGRYGAPAFPVAVVCPSARAGRAEVFAFGEGCPAWQMSLDPLQPARPRLAGLVAHVRGEGRSPRAGRGLACWGAEGGAICARYFGRWRARLQWVELAGGRPADELAEAVSAIARRVALEPPDPGEFRLGGTDGDRLVPD